MWLNCLCHKLTPPTGYVLNNPFFFNTNLMFLNTFAKRINIACFYILNFTRQNKSKKNEAEVARNKNILLKQIVNFVTLIYSVGVKRLQTKFYITMHEY